MNRLKVGCSIFFSIALLLSAWLALPAYLAADGPLSERYDPVVLSGAQLPGLLGAEVTHIGAFAHRPEIGTLAPIAVQVDEKSAAGMFTTRGNSVLDARDEVVFLAAEVGTQAMTPSLTFDGAEITPAATITVTDPLGGVGWVYLFRLPQPRAATADYIRYQPEMDVIASAVYSLGFEAQRGLRDALFLQGDTVSEDLLRAEAVRANLSALVFGVPVSARVTEENVRLTGVHAVDGPVRVVRVSTQTVRVSVPGLGSTEATVVGTLFGYPNGVILPANLLSETGDSVGLEVEVEVFSYSLSLTEVASGTTYFDANVSNGVSVDGQPDSVPRTPFSNWSQVGGTVGTMVNVFSIPADFGGQRQTHYRDVIPDHIGETGFQLQNPSPGEAPILAYTYFFTQSSPTLGAEMARQVVNPLQVEVASEIVLNVVYLPLVLR